MLTERATAMPGSLAFEFLPGGGEEGQRLSFAELDEEARFIAAHLRANVEPGAVALLLYAPGLEFIASFFGCLHAGLRPAPAMLSLSPGGLRRTAGAMLDSGAGTVLANSAHLQRFKRALASLVDVDAVAWIATDEVDVDEVAAAQLEFAANPEGPAFIQYSSGSTGDPKGVAISHRNILHNLSLLNDAFKTDADDLCVSWLPHYHDMGLVAGILHSIYSGIPSVLMAPGTFLRRPIEWLDTISRYGATLSGGPNFGYDHCLAGISEADRRRLDLRSWSVAISGAEPVRAGTIERFSNAFAESGFQRKAFYPTYGLADATLMVSGGRRADGPTVHAVLSAELERNRVVPADAEDGAGVQLVVACGEPRAPVTIVDPDTLQPCAPGGVGEILVAGPSVCMGYWCGVDAPLRDPCIEIAGHPGVRFLRTGDLGFLEQGQLCVTGRAKDLIISRGRNVHPQDIEASIVEDDGGPGRLEACAFSVEASGEERLTIVIEAGPTDSARVDFDAFVTSVRNRVWSGHELVLWKLAILAPGGIPRTTSGKRQRAKCRAELMSGTLRPLKQWCADEG